uniref:AB hydrolase-1 domain-containing protein n=1 Tax=Amphora coffeiformis TaxID=265554 RepID=A0A7S3L5A8_9STRA|mmetsp:Transcript_24118/g.45868  ORF Transcript_24118/g.45868 Transcript_24118/m.45868 type:complete len:344 (-) Transcript_24118:76-1107(-)|eukprot:scaffold34925_cov150-Amphora_coffeaeformis.AAC.4
MSLVRGSLRLAQRLSSTPPSLLWTWSFTRTTTTTSALHGQLHPSRRTITLASEWISAADDTVNDNDSNVFVFLHGLLGSRRNLQTFAKTLCGRLGRRGLLLDIRGHGGSQIIKDKNGSTPTTLSDCANDVYETLQPYAADLERVRWTMVGHSLGGRVSMLYALQQAQNKVPLPLLPQNIWLLDTVPGALDASVRHVVNVAHKLENSLEPLPKTRSALVEALVRDEGMSLGIAQWLASSFTLKSRSFSFDLQIVQEIMADFDEAQFMEWIRAEPVPVDLVRGCANKAWESAAGHVEELEDWHDEAEREFRIHRLPNAGHWVHMDDLPGLVNIIEDVQRELDSRT